MIAEGCEQKFSVAGTELWALPSAGVYWPEEETLFVADLHLGKGQAMRSQSIAVPAGSTQHTLARLMADCKAYGCRRVVVLGDLWHHSLGGDGAPLLGLQSFLDEFCGEVILVEGNHDRSSRVFTDSTRIRLLTDSTLMGPFCLKHEPEPRGDAYTLAGHLHPGVRLMGSAKSSVKFACFWVRPALMVLPAFGSFTGVCAIRPTVGDRVFVIADGRVHAVSLGAD